MKDLQYRVKGSTSKEMLVDLTLRVQNTERSSSFLMDLKDLKIGDVFL